MRALCQNSSDAQGAQPLAMSFQPDHWAQPRSFDCNASVIEPCHQGKIPIYSVNPSSSLPLSLAPQATPSFPQPQVIESTLAMLEFQTWLARMQQQPMEHSKLERPQAHSQQPGSPPMSQRHHGRMEAQRQRRHRSPRCPTLLCQRLSCLSGSILGGQSGVPKCRGVFHRLARPHEFVEADYVDHPQIPRDPLTLRLTIGSPTVVCGHCKALHWPLEKTCGTVANPGFGMCCNLGKVHLPPLEPSPPILQQLLTATTPAAKHFRANIRAYNSIFQMASTGRCWCHLF